MSTPAINTIVKMMEDLPEDAQDKVVELLRELIAEIQDEAAWQASFNTSQGKLEAAARKARGEILKGKSTPMDFSQL
jgi:hypothetical protein